jgi:hypothetical protein
MGKWKEWKRRKRRGSAISWGKKEEHRGADAGWPWPAPATEFSTGAPPFAKSSKQLCRCNNFKRCHWETVIIICWEIEEKVLVGKKDQI